MLFKTRFLELIKKKKVKTAFRKWTRPTVKEGGTLITAIGQLAIQSVDVISYSEITEEDIASAGYDHRKDLDDELRLKKEGRIYRIRFLLLGEDPRIKLRGENAISPNELDALRQKLTKLNQSGPLENWTSVVLNEIRKHPGKRAQDIADSLGVEKDWLKPNIRKLKNLGLTISLETGYKLSPRGEMVFEKLKR